MYRESFQRTIVGRLILSSLSLSLFRIVRIRPYRLSLRVNVSVGVQRPTSHVRLRWSSDFEEARIPRGFVGRPIDPLREIVRNVTIAYES